MEDYNSSNTRILVGDLENASAINTIILLTMKRIYNAMKKEQKPQIMDIKMMWKKYF